MSKSTRRAASFSPSRCANASNSAPVQASNLRSVQRGLCSGLSGSVPPWFKKTVFGFIWGKYPKALIGAEFSMMLVTSESRTRPDCEGLLRYRCTGGRLRRRLPASSPSTGGTPCRPSEEDGRSHQCTWPGGVLYSPNENSLYTSNISERSLAVAYREHPSVF